MPSLNIAIQMDAIESIKFASDSSLALGLEAQNRGHALYYYQPKDLSVSNGKVTAALHEITLRNDKDNYFTIGAEISSDFEDIDVVLMRQDPPYDMNYLTYTYMLERLPKHVMVLNNPAEVRNCPEKLFVLNFNQFMAPTLVTANFAEVEKFFHEHKDIIIKPLYAHGGLDINRVNRPEQLQETFEIIMQAYHAPLMVQSFLPEVAKGDKRIMFVDGQVVGAINRIPKEGDIRSNLAQGGTAHATELTAREKEICAAIGPQLKKRGLLLAGIDVIGGYVTEINVTSPTGIPSINRLCNTNVAAIFWDAVENYKQNSSWMSV